jgi:hypothetical protein
MMIKHREIRYRGFVVALDYDSKNGGWVYSLVREATGMDYGSNNDPTPFKEAQNDAKWAVDNLLVEIEEYERLGNAGTFTEDED